MNAVLDGRNLNHMDPDTKLVHMRLEAWGRLCADRIRAWPEATLLARLIEYHEVGAAQPGKPPELPAHVAVVDAAISRLGDIDRKVVVAYYTRQDPPEVIAKKVRMRYRQFQAVLRRARWRVGGYLEAMEKFDRTADLV